MEADQRDLAYRVMGAIEQAQASTGLVPTLVEIGCWDLRRAFPGYPQPLAIWGVPVREYHGHGVRAVVEMEAPA